MHLQNLPESIFEYKVDLPHVYRKSLPYFTYIKINRVARFQSTSCNASLYYETLPYLQPVINVHTTYNRLQKRYIKHFNTLLPSGCSILKYCKFAGICFGFTHGVEKIPQWTLTWAEAKIRCQQLDSYLIVLNEKYDRRTL